MTTDNDIRNSLFSGPQATPDELNTEIIENEDGSVEVAFLDELVDIDEDIVVEEHYANLSPFLDEMELSEIACDVLDAAEEDDCSRHGHIQTLLSGLENLGLDDSMVETPFDGACTVFHPLIMENAVKIQAKAEGELLPAKGPVRTQILGTPTEDTELQAARVKTHMNWQITKAMSEFYPNSQKALLQSALFGDAFKKNYYDPILGRVVDCLVPIDRLIINSACETIESADRITEVQYLSEREMKHRIYSGQYDDLVDIGEPYEIEKTELGEKIDRLLGYEGSGEGYIVYEQHCYLDLPGFEDPSGVPLPYIVTVEKQSRQILAIRRNWKVNTNRFQKREYFTQYPFVPGFGFYHLGYIHLLGNFQNTLTAIMRSLVDAGSFANMQGGIKSKALRILDDDKAISPGEFRDAEFYGQDISKVIYPFQFKEPSSTLFQLLQFIESRGQKYADSAEQVVADAANYGPVGTTMALLDASTKFFSTIYKRFHSAQEHQLKIIADLNWENLPEDDIEVEFNIPGQEIRISRRDYDERIDIIPVSDPNISSSAHRLTLASQKLQSGLQSPQLHDMRELYKQYYIALGDENYEKYLPKEEEPVRAEPMEDIMLATQGKPIKAFPDQDHEAHIAVKTAFLNDPAVQSSQAFAAVAPVIQANIREHIVMRFAEQMQGAETLGMNAQDAAQQITEFNTFKAQNPLGQLDPKQLLAQAEMKRQENEALKLQLQAQEQQADAAIDIANIQTEIRKQNLDMAKFKIQLDHDEELAKISEAIGLVKQSI